MRCNKYPLLTKFVRLQQGAKKCDRFWFIHIFSYRFHPIRSQLETVLDFWLVNVCMKKCELIKGGLTFGLLAVRWLDIGQASSRSIKSLSSDVFDWHTSTGSEPFSLLVCFDATKFVLLSVFTLSETIWPKVCSKSRLKSAKSALPVDACGSKTSLLKLPN